MNQMKLLRATLLIIIILFLTFLIPAEHWLAQSLCQTMPAVVLFGNLFIIAVIYIWNVRNNCFAFLPAAPMWKRITILAAATALIFLLIDIRHPSPSAISGQPRTVYDVLDVVLFAAVAEELVFRGVLWQIFKQRFRMKRNLDLLLLAGTSTLFGVMHFGYWMQAGLQLPAQAYIHVLSMMAAGSIFGWLRLKSRSLAAPAGIHILANAAILYFQA